MVKTGDNYRYLKLVLLFFVSFTITFSGFIMINPSVAAELNKKPFLVGDNIPEIRTKIAANGYDFKVANNWVVKLPQNLRARMRYRRHSPSSMAEYRVRERKTAAPPLNQFLDQPLPSSFDLRNVGSTGRSYIGPIRQQGSCGACYAFGACAAAEATYNLATGSCNQNCADFSEAFIVFCLDPLYTGFDGCRGSDYDYEELEALVQNGVCYENQLPYDPAHRSCAAELDISTVHFNSWYRLPCNDIHAIKAAIYHFGAVDVAVATNPAFDAYASGIYEDSKTECLDADGGICYYAPTDHVASLVGWDDNAGDGYWILRNSWGREWGENGYMRIKYNSAHVACAACYLTFTPKRALASQPKPEGVVAPWLKLLLSD